MTLPFTVIVPARNEAVNLERTAPALRQALHNLPAKVIYVLNATTDHSAVIINRVFGGAAHTIQRSEPGKPAALNAGDREGAEGITIYLDADAVVAPDMFPALLSPLEDGLADLVAPRIDVDAGHPGPVAQRVSRVWADQMTRRPDAFMVCTAFSPEGRRLRGPWRDVVADDDWARGRIAPARRHIVEAARVRIVAPCSLSAWLTVRGRWIRGQRELKRLGATGSGHTRIPLRGTPLDLAAYYAVRLAAEPVAVFQRLNGTDWGRDESTRRPDDVRNP